MGPQQDSNLRTRAPETVRGDAAASLTCADVPPSGVSPAFYRKALAGTRSMAAARGDCARQHGLQRDAQNKLPDTSHPVKRPSESLARIRGARSVIPGGPLMRVPLADPSDHLEAQPGHVLVPADLHLDKVRPPGTAAAARPGPREGPATHQWMRLLNERFTAIAAQLGGSHAGRRDTSDQTRP